MCDLGWMLDTHYTCATVSVSLSDVVASLAWITNSDLVALFECVQLIELVVATVYVYIIGVVVSQQLAQVSDVVSSLRPLSLHNRELCHRCSRRTRCVQSAGVR